MDMLQVEKKWRDKWDKENSNTYWRFRCFVKFIIADLSGIIFFLNCIDYFKNNVYNYYV